jgi:putative ABC transport system ATP-binding protein
MNKIIHLQSIVKNYYPGTETVQALRSVSVDINKNEYVAIMGPSGSGKSTLMNIIGCLDTPTSGTYILNSKDASKLVDNQLAEIRNKEIGFVFQTFNLLPRYSALENVMLPLVYAGIPKNERMIRAKAALESVGLADRMEHKPNELSGGQRQRVSVARAMINNPAIILADEPTGNLDTRTSFEIMELFQDLNERGRTIVYVTHELDIAKFATRNVVFRDGHIQKENFVTDRLYAREILKTLPVEIIEEFDS